MIDLEAICDRHGIHLDHLSARMQHMGGVCLRHKGDSLILYDHDRKDKDFVIAHELGHILLGHLEKRGTTRVYDSDQWQEIEANLFAIVMLATSEVLTA
ncbi:MAG: ImmA/IrrE family metallo-endopeptidase [Christensenellaceae bacterium]|nr:ImmA/IrrE family metallo-endopeptidase [Christensenellaceae bacterium]